MPTGKVKYFGVRSGLSSPRALIPPASRHNGRSARCNSGSLGGVDEWLGLRRRRSRRVSGRQGYMAGCRASSTMSGSPSSPAARSAASRHTRSGRDEGGTGTRRPIGRRAGAFSLHEYVQAGGVDGCDAGQVDVDPEDVAPHRGLDGVEELRRCVDVDLTFNYESKPCPVDADDGVEQTTLPPASVQVAARLGMLAVGSTGCEKATSASW